MAAGGAEAIGRADAIAAGRVDLLGYHDLLLRPRRSGSATESGRISGPSALTTASRIRGRRSTGIAIRSSTQRAAPVLERGTVPPAAAATQIILELNRHQHFSPGRAGGGGHRPALRRCPASRRLDGRQPAARRCQLGQHAGAGPAIAVVDLGPRMLRRAGRWRPCGRGRAGRRRASVAGGSAARARPAAAARRAEPVDLLQPQHASARRSPGPLRRRPRASRTAPGPRVGGPRPPHPGRRMARQITPDGGHVERSSLSPLYARFLPAGTGVGATDRDDAGPSPRRRGGWLDSPARRRRSRTPPRIATTTAPVLPICGRDSATRPTRGPGRWRSAIPRWPSARRPRSARDVRAPQPQAGSAGLSPRPAVSTRSATQTAIRRLDADPVGELGDSATPSAAPPAATIWSSTAGRTAT